MNDAAHPVLTHRNGETCVLLDGMWFKPYDVGGEGIECDNSEHRTNEIPQGLVDWEYGVERSLPQWNNGEPFMEWGASIGMSHRYDYTAESVKGLAGGRPVFRRRRVKFNDFLGESESF
jgi:hypothetical protein